MPLHFHRVLQYFGYLDIKIFLSYFNTFYFNNWPPPSTSTRLKSNYGWYFFRYYIYFYVLHYFIFTIMIFTQLIQTNLRTKELGKKVEYYNRLDSTNEEAWELLDEGYQHGSLSSRKSNKR